VESWLSITQFHLLEVQKQTTEERELVVQDQWKFVFGSLYLCVVDLSTSTPTYVPIRYNIEDKRSSDAKHSNLSPKLILQVGEIHLKISLVVYLVLLSLQENEFLHEPSEDHRVTTFPLQIHYLSAPCLLLKQQSTPTIPSTL
jgi:hypothetical protein